MQLGPNPEFTESYPLAKLSQLQAYLELNPFAIPEPRNTDRTHRQHNLAQTTKFLKTAIRARGILKVRYSYARGRTSGRRYSRLSAQGLRGRFRSTLLAPEWQDIDIVNCAPTILSQLASRALPSTPLLQLQSLVDDRDGFFERVETTAPGTRSETKERINRALMDHRPRATFTSPVLKMLNTESAMLAESLKTFGEFAGLVQHAKPSAGSFLSLCYQVVEDRAVSAAVEWCRTKGIEIHSLIFDGFIAQGDAEIDFDALNGHVEQVTSFKIQFIRKEWTGIITDLPEATTPDGPSPLDPIPVRSYEEVFQDRYHEWVKVGQLLYNPRRPDDPPRSFEELFRERAHDLCHSPWLSEDQDGDSKRRPVCFWREFVQDQRQDTLGRTQAFPYPLTDECPPHHFNTWTPFPYIDDDREPNEEYVGMIKKFLLLLVNSHEPSYEFLTQFLANMVQYPQNKPSVAPCLVTPEGAGKDFMVSSIKLAIGSKRVWSCLMTELDAPFTSKMPAALLVMPNEGVKRDFDRMRGKLNHLITDEEIQFNRKFGALWDQHSIHRFLFATNVIDAVPVSGTTRRFKVMTCDQSLTNGAFPWDHYWTAYHDDAEEWGYAWWSFLSTLECPPTVTRFHLGTPSAFENAIRGRHIPPLERWLHWKLMTAHSTPTMFHLVGEFETLALEAHAWCTSKQLDNIPGVGTLVATVRNFSARPEFSKRERLQVGGGTQVAGSTRMSGWRINKGLIKDTWTRYGFYEDDGSEAFNLEVEEEHTGQFEG